MSKIDAGTLVLDLVVSTKSMSAGLKRAEMLAARSGKTAASVFRQHFTAAKTVKKANFDLIPSMSGLAPFAGINQNTFAHRSTLTGAAQFPAHRQIERARGVFRTGFSDGLHAAIDGDLGSFLEQKLQSLAANMFDRAVENLADAVFDQLSQIAPGFLGQITGDTNLPNALNGATSAATSVAGQAASTGTQAAQTTASATATATAVTTAFTTGGATAATAIGTSMTTAGTAVAGQIAAAMASSGATAGLSNFAGAFASGGVIGTGKFGLVGEEGPELISAGTGPLRITPLDGQFNKRLQGFATNGLESRGSSQATPSNVVMNISGVKDLGSFVKSQGTIEADMAAAMRRAQSDF